jgi:hypothetical protein
VDAGGVFQKPIDQEKTAGEPGCLRIGGTGGLVLTLLYPPPKTKINP